VWRPGLIQIGYVSRCQRIRWAQSWSGILATCFTMLSQKGIQAVTMAAESAANLSQPGKAQEGRHAEAVRWLWHGLLLQHQNTMALLKRRYRVHVVPNGHFRSGRGMHKKMYSSFSRD